MVSLKRAIRTKTGGFTVIEMVITLAITISLIGLGTVELKSYQQQLLLTNTTKEVKGAIEQAARASMLQHQAIKIAYWPITKKIIFSGNPYQRTLQLNSAITIDGLSNMLIKDDGTLSARTITVSIGQRSQKVKLQMLWGRAIDAQE